MTTTLSSTTVSRWSNAALGWTAAAVLLLVWQLGAASARSPYFPTPIDIFGNVYDRWFSAGLSHGILTDSFYSDILPSIGRLLVGLAIAWVVGITLGVLLGRIPVLAMTIEPLLHFMRGLPGPVLLPLALVLVGTGSAMRIGLITFGAIWPVLFNTYSAVRQVPEGFEDAARSTRISRTGMLFRVILPSASTGIFAGIKVSTSLGIILLIASELYAASDGIGFGLSQAQRSFEFLTMWSYIVALSILGYLSNLLLVRIEHSLLDWHRLRMAIDN
ncbi:ABC transporter permease subunit [Rhodococcus pyridinivorans]|uniref:ABC transporter permease n=1 Tax=Rhodococcus pyridinivorans TaxID=103816 RepID=UPI002078CFA0|nr:ABC transporter permease subunit [Rhodococcus pyridinivorans]USI91484.1 ABC transporter permease subunit [Rhodococcus pyridinivorans]UTM38389.1 ABC transporter permease subunit [Rhodococcus pyridinivorans]